MQIFRLSALVLPCAGLRAWGQVGLQGLLGPWALAQHRIFFFADRRGILAKKSSTRQEGGMEGGRESGSQDGWAMPPSRCTTPSGNEYPSWRRMA